MNLNVKYSSVLIYVALVCLSACSSMDQQTANDSMHTQSVASLGNVELHTHELANELFANVSTNKQYRYAVVGFVPVKTMVFNAKEQGPLMLLGHQLEQGMMTEASRRGLITQDFKVANNIQISDVSDSVITRDVERLSQIKKIDFFITGTITEQQEGAIVNARVVHVKSKDVVAAASKFFPADLFWQREKVSSRDGMIYRTGM